MSTSRTKNSIRNIFWVYFNTFISLILNFANRTIFIHYLGIEFLGINGLFGNILTILSLADLGFGTAMAYSYYKPIAEGDTEKVVALNCFLQEIIQIYCISYFYCRDTFNSVFEVYSKYGNRNRTLKYILFININ